MIRFTQGNLLEARTEALVNTVNTVGVMGKGIALMFKKRFAENYRLYSAACKAGDVETGKVHVTAVDELGGPRWIVNFPTKRHWRSPSQMAWVTEGLHDLRRFLLEHQVKSVAVPPLGAGNGGLDWPDVRDQIVAVLGDLDVEVWVYEPSSQYLQVAKRSGVEKLAPARALIAELVRRYWVLGMPCSLVEIHQLAWLLERALQQRADTGPMPLCWGSCSMRSMAVTCSATRPWARRVSMRRSGSTKRAKPFCTLISIQKRSSTPAPWNRQPL
jgi:O-acetyl-ADP-ribose deacetylase (regulator of RNase III)